MLNINILCPVKKIVVMKVLSNCKNRQKQRQVFSIGTKIFYVLNCYIITFSFAMLILIALICNIINYVTVIVFQTFVSGVKNSNNMS